VKPGPSTRELAFVVVLVATICVTVCVLVSWHHVPIGPAFVLTQPLRVPEPIVVPAAPRPIGDVALVANGRCVVTVTLEAQLELARRRARLDITSFNVGRIVADQERSER
jgi:hypothetical protein